MRAQVNISNENVPNRPCGGKLMQLDDADHQLCKEGNPRWPLLIDIDDASKGYDFILRNCIMICANPCRRPSYVV